MCLHVIALNPQSGERLWEYDAHVDLSKNYSGKYQLPAGGQATPMTYVFKGKQYVVIAAGGHGKLGTKQGDYVLAFALP